MLTLSPVHVAFPATAVDSSASPFPVSLLNTGNAAVTVAFGAATNTDFGATYDGSDAGTSDAGDAPVTLAPSATVGLGNLNATFTPTQTAAETATIPIVVTGAVCAGSATALTASGTGQGGIYSSQTTDLFFGSAGGTPGFTACGGNAAATVSFTITNTGNESFTWQPSLASTGTATGTSYSVSPAGANLLNAGASATVTVSPTAGVPATSLTTTDLYADVLNITTNAPADTPHAITLHQTAFGAILGTTSSSLPFGSTPAATSLTALFSLTNSGNAPATVGVQVTETDANSTTAFSISPNTGVVSPTAPFSATVTFNAPSGPPATFTGTIAVSNTAGGTTGLCAPLPALTQMTASSTNGKVAVSPSAVNFGNRGLVNCGTKAQALPVTVRNSGNTAYTLTSQLQRGSGSPFTLTTTCSDGSTNNVAPAGSCTISVAPETIPFPSEVTPNLYGDLLEINTSVIGDTTHFVQLNMTAQGAILTSAEAQPVAFGPIFANGASPVIYNYAFTNIGNASAR